MRNSNTGNPIQGFTPSEIRTNVTILDFTAESGRGIVGIRLNVEEDYYIGADSGNVATMPAGVTIINPNVGSFTFSAPVSLEIMAE